MGVQACCFDLYAVETLNKPTQLVTLSGTIKATNTQKLCKCADAITKEWVQIQLYITIDPLQIIRYKRNGQVLWIADTEYTIKEQSCNIPKCELCGGERQFEFQIMPQMLNYLKDANVDWGVIAVYTCSKSCPLPNDKGYVEEFCIKQDIVNNQ